MRRKEIKAKTISQRNDTSCFKGNSNSRKKAKRSSSKKLRKSGKLWNHIIGGG